MSWRKQATDRTWVVTSSGRGRALHGRWRRQWSRQCPQSKGQRCRRRGCRRRPWKLDPLSELWPTGWIVLDSLLTSLGSTAPSSFPLLLSSLSHFSSSSVFSVEGDVGRSFLAEWKMEGPRPAKEWNGISFILSAFSASTARRSSPLLVLVRVGQVTRWNHTLYTTTASAASLSRPRRGKEGVMVSFLSLQPFNRLRCKSLFSSPSRQSLDVSTWVTWAPWSRASRERGPWVAMMSLDPSRTRGQSETRR